MVLLKKENQDEVEIKAYAKINLNFTILRKLPNGYHEIKSIFQAINLYDTLVISKCHSRFNLTGSIICPLRSNLITKAKKTLEDYVQRELSCRIHLIKAIPIGAGLGGGSSDAAATIVGLNEIYRLNLSLEELKKIAIQVGCDVPFFVSNTGTALVKGVGEKINPIKKNFSKFFVLARPHKRIETAQVYRLYDKTGKNFFEIVQKLCPEIKKIYNYFSEITDKHGMSGSGPTVFAGFDSYYKAIRAIEDFSVEKFDGDLFVCKQTMRTYDIIKRQDKD